MTATPTLDLLKRLHQAAATQLRYSEAAQFCLGEKAFAQFRKEVNAMPSADREAFFDWLFPRHVVCVRGAEYGVWLQLPPDDLGNTRDLHRAAVMDYRGTRNRGKKKRRNALACVTGFRRIVNYYKINP